MLKTISRRSLPFPFSPHPRSPARPARPRRRQLNKTVQAPVIQAEP